MRTLGARLLQGQVSTVVTWALLAVAITVNAALQPTFFTLYSITSNFATFAPLVLVTIAQAVVVIGGGLDLSLGATVALSSVVAITVMDGRPEMVPLGFLTAIGVGALCGLFNGVVVSVVRLQPLIATFASSSIFSGLALTVMPKPGGTVPSPMTQAYRMAIAGLPVSVLVPVTPRVFLTTYQVSSFICIWTST